MVGNFSKKSLRFVTSLSIAFSSTLISLTPAQAAITSVTATGTSPSICNQTGTNLGTNAGDVTAERIAGGDCVIKFNTAGISYSWTAPYNVTSISVLVVGAGGGGGAGGFNNIDNQGGGGGGGGGGGQVTTATYSSITASQSFSVSVGSGGAGATTGGISSSSWAGSNGRDGGSSSFSSTSAAGGKAGYGGGAWELSASGSTACNNSRSFTIDGSSIYYIDGVGGRSGASGNSANGGVLPFCSTDSTLGRGGAGASGSGNGGTATRLTSRTGTPNAAGVGTTNSLTGSSVEYGTGGVGGVGGMSNPTSTQGAAGSRAGMGGAGGTGSRADNNSSTGALGGAGAAGLVVVRYTPDTTAPTITSSSTFDMNENIAVSTTAATIRTNESATITISATGDFAKFTITVSDTTTALIRFISSPNFEIPADIGADNSYSLTVNAADLYGNSSSQNITIRVLDVNENPGLSGTPYKGQQVTITVSVGAPGTVRFFANGKRITNCLARPTSGSNPSITATCNWKPAVQGRVSLTSTLTPSNISLPVETTPPTIVQVLKRTNNRG
jgi:hypothetical protein